MPGFRPETAAPPAMVSPDRGPWMVNTWPDGRVVLQSDDFKHDVALIINGDFGSSEDKQAYAKGLAAWMNANLAPVPATNSN